MLLPPAIVVHGLKHARLALAPGRPVTLLSAVGAASYAGAMWWRTMVTASGTSWPDVLDCADAAGRALEALDCGCRTLVLLPCPAWTRVADRAASTGAVVLSDRPPALDLGLPHAPGRIEAWLGIG